MADIGGDGTTTGGKLEGFQIRPCAKSSHFTASEIPSVEDVHGMTLVISKALPAFPGHDVGSTADRLIRA
jgi:hypothetical protein